MPKPTPFARVDIDVDAGTETKRLFERPEPDTPFRILILGDFSGRANRGICEPRLAGRRPLSVDRDNFDQVLAKLQPEVRLPVAGGEARQASVRFRELEDFHPDRIFRQVPLFKALRETRARLSDRATFAAAAAALQQPAPAPAPQAPPRVNLQDLFERTLEETETRAADRPARALDDFSALVRDIVAPHLVPKADPQQAELVAQVDAATSAQMRDFLHNPDLQALEAAWRAMFFLVRRLETGASLKLYLLDVSKEELAAELRSAPDLRASGLYRIAVEETLDTPGGEPWALLAGLYTFDHSLDDVVLLGFLGGIARAAGAPFLAAASPGVIGCESVGKTPERESWRAADPDEHRGWKVLRSLPEAPHLGLALPRFLLRLPYGKDTEPIEEFEFEELSSAAEHESYLWGNPSAACVCLLGQAFSEYGWDMRPGQVRDIDGLPLHIYREDGESRLKPCAEALLTEQAAEDILERGIMPLLSVKGRDAVRLFRFQSLADPPAALAGRWG